MSRRGAVKRLRLFIFVRDKYIWFFRGHFECRMDTIVIKIAVCLGPKPIAVLLSNRPCIIRFGWTASGKLVLKPDSSGD